MTSTEQLAARYFDGRSAQPRAAVLQLRGGWLCIAAEGVTRKLPIGEVDWPERQRHGRRIAHLPGGGSVQCDDAAAWDAWLRAAGIDESWVVRAQQSWRAVLAAIVAVAVLAVGIQSLGIPWLARTVAAQTPWRVDELLGQATLAFVDDELMQASQLPTRDQQRIRTAMIRAVSAADTAPPPWQIEFRKSRIGPNALALPGGILILTDQLVALADGNDDLLLGVLAHELGHVRHRHGLRMVVQVSALGALSSLVFGDFSALLAGAPVVLGQAQYSRDAEREADAEAVRLLRAAGISPRVMLQLFERLAEWRARQRPETPQDAWGIAFSSHPPDAERLRFFEQAAGPR